mmetsp:Transcript_102699/g.257465  ORF Transcript_102699/g.257465 Transcript_102699/m.257465 type:complete len:211 (+) Transcript_102699:247-879(+)
MPSFGSAPFAFYNEIRSNRQHMDGDIYALSLMSACVASSTDRTDSGTRVGLFLPQGAGNVHSGQFTQLPQPPVAEREAHRVQSHLVRLDVHLQHAQEQLFHPMGPCRFHGGGDDCVETDNVWSEPILADSVEPRFCTRQIARRLCCRNEIVITFDVQLNTRVSGGFEPPLRICKISSASSMVHQYVERPHVWHHFHFNRTLVPAQWGIWI